jgi:hypothetical protein
MDAAVTLKATPREFDLIREAVVEARANAKERGRSRDLPGGQKAAARQREAELAQLEAKLR